MLVVWDVFWDELDEVWVESDVLAFKSLIHSSAHHSEREIIVTHGKSQSLATAKLNIIAVRNRHNNQTFLFLFMQRIPKAKQFIYKIFCTKCKRMKYKKSWFSFLTLK